jgi:hypothetical protein
MAVKRHAHKQVSSHILENTKGTKHINLYPTQEMIPWARDIKIFTAVIIMQLCNILRLGALFENVGQGWK